METIINKPTEDNWINGIGKYLLQFDAIVREDKGYEEFIIKTCTDESDLENEFLNIIRYTPWFKEFCNAFGICETEAYAYYCIFKYLGKDPEVMMRNLTNMAIMERLNG